MTKKRQTYLLTFCFAVMYIVQLQLASTNTHYRMWDREVINLSTILTEHGAEQGTPNNGQCQFRLQQDPKPDQGLTLTAAFILHSYYSTQTWQILSELAVASRRVWWLQLHITAKQKLSKSVWCFCCFSCMSQAGWQPFVGPRAGLSAPLP